MNEYLTQQLNHKLMQHMPETMVKHIKDDFEAMDEAGVDNKHDQDVFIFVRMHAPQIVNKLFNKKISPKFASKLAKDVFMNRDKHKIDSILDLMSAIHLALKKALPFEMLKVAYPQGTSFYPRPSYDMNKWVEVAKTIYNSMRQGKKRDQALQNATQNWEKGERMDFDRWLKYYEEGNHTKYKLAYKRADIAGNGSFLSAETPGYFVPSARKSSSIPTPIPAMPGPGQPSDSNKADTDVNDIRDKIEKQRTRLIGRLTAAENLLSSIDGQFFAGDDQETMLEMLQSLKRKIQTVNKRTLKSSLFEDYIYRTANLLHVKGKPKAAAFFYKIAQMPGMDAPPGGPPGGPPGPPMPGVPGADDPAAKENTVELLREFFDNLRTGVHDPRAEEREEEKEKKSAWLYNLISEAQAGPPMPPPDIEEMPAAPRPMPKPEPKPELKQEPKGDHTDAVIDAALGKVGIADVVKRLEMLVSVYNQREISRQLAVLDIMMDNAGLASFFPNLGEAMAKALEANQYIGSRLEDILTKLKGSMQSSEATRWIEPQKEHQTPESAAVINTLKTQEANEEKRKELRKKKELQQSQNLDTEAAGRAAAELQQPAVVEKAPPIPVR